MINVDLLMCDPCLFYLIIKNTMGIVGELVMTKSKKITIGAAQFNIIEANKEQNLEKAAKYIFKAADLGTDLVLLPEVFLTDYSVKIDIESLAEPLDGPSISILKELARKNKIAIVGSYLELDIDGSVYNTAFFIDDQGKILGSYRKMHLFDQEKKFVKEGNELTNIVYRDIHFGILICFDIEFPEPARALSLSGMEVLLVCSANMDPYGLFHRVFSVSRAIENHTFVAYCNRTGENSSYRFIGESCIVSPTGEIMGELNINEGLLVRELELHDIIKSKKVYNYLKDRKVKM